MKSIHDDLVRRIVKFLPLKDQVTCQAVSVKLRNLSKEHLRQLKEIRFVVESIICSTLNVSHQSKNRLCNSTLFLDNNQVMEAARLISTLCAGLVVVNVDLPKLTNMDDGFLDSLPDNIECLIAPLASVKAPKNPKPHLKHLNLGWIDFDIYDRTLFPSLESVEVDRFKFEGIKRTAMPHGFKRLTTNTMYSSFVNYVSGIDFLAGISESPAAQTVEALGPIRVRYFMENKEHKFPNLKSLKIRRHGWDGEGFNRILRFNPQLEELFILSEGEFLVNELHPLPKGLASFGLGCGHNLTRETIEKIGEMMPNLISLHVRSGHFYKEGEDFETMLQIYQVLQSPGFLPKLEKLEVVIVDFQPRDDFLQQHIVPVLRSRLTEGNLKSFEIINFGELRFLNSALVLAPDLQQEFTSMSPVITTTASLAIPVEEIEGDLRIRARYFKTVNLSDVTEGRVSGLKFVKQRNSGFDQDLALNKEL